MKKELWKELLWIYGLSTTSGLLIGWGSKLLGINGWGTASMITVYILVAISSGKLIKWYKENEKYNVSLGTRELFLGSMDTTNCSKLFFEISYLNKQSNQPIKLFIDSTGGELDGFRILANGIQASKAPVLGIVIGKASSAAALALQCCHKRVALPHTRIFFHQIQNNVNLKLTGAAISIIEGAVRILLQQRRESRIDQKEINNLVMKKSGLSIEQLESIEKKHLTPEEALKLNLIDEVVTEI